MNKNTHSKGFSIIEILIVLIILGVLAGTALPVLTGQSEKARRAEALAALAQIRNSQLRYFQEKFTFTLQNDDLDFDFSDAGLSAGGQTSHFSYDISNASAASFEAQGTRNTVNQGDGQTCISITEAGTIGECLNGSLKKSIFIPNNSTFVIPDVDVFFVNNIIVRPAGFLTFENSRTLLIFQGSLGIENGFINVNNGSIEDVRLSLPNGSVTASSSSGGFGNRLFIPTITCSESVTLNVIGTSSRAISLFGDITFKISTTIDPQVNLRNKRLIQDPNCR